MVALGIKLGMTRIFDEKGCHIPVTCVEYSDKVIDKRTKEKNGYEAVIVALGTKKAKHVNKPQLKHFENIGADLPKFVREFRTDKPSSVAPDQPLEKNDKVDISGITIGKGFAGGMKRHNFGGLRASHGVSISHRSHGSTGQCQDPGRVFKGKKMAGHMGAKRMTQQNLEIVDIDTDSNILYIKGSIPGPKGSLVEIKKSVKVSS